MACENCKTGFKWNGTAIGKESKLNENDVYVTGDSKAVAILVITDLFGWTLPNIRLLADAYAQEIQATVYVPDFFGGEKVHPDALSDPEMAKNFDLNAFLARNNKDIRWPEIEAAAKTLKSQYKKVGAMGFCYGGWACCKLAANPSLVDAVSTAHPSGLEKSEIDGARTPVQVLSPQFNPVYTAELKAYTLDSLPKLGVPWEYIYFPGMAHGFAVRGDSNNKKQREGFERAKRSAANFFLEFLH